MTGFNFKFFQTDKLSYLRPVDNTSLPVTFSGVVDNQGHQPQVYVIIILPDGTPKQLGPSPLLVDGSFQTADSLNKFSETGQYTAQAHCSFQQDRQNALVSSAKITYQVR